MSNYVKLDVIEFGFSHDFGARTTKTRPATAMAIELELPDSLARLEGDVVILNLKGVKVMTNLVTDALKPLTEQEVQEVEDAEF